MTAEELYKKEFGNADSIPKESVIRLLKHFAKVLEIERNKALHVADVRLSFDELTKKILKYHAKSEYQQTAIVMLREIFKTYET